MLLVRMVSDYLQIRQIGALDEFEIFVFLAGEDEGFRHLSSNHRVPLGTRPNPLHRDATNLTQVATLIF